MWLHILQTKGEFSSNMQRSKEDVGNLWIDAWTSMNQFNILQGYDGWCVGLVKNWGIVQLSEAYLGINLSVFELIEYLNALMADAFG